MSALERVRRFSEYDREVETAADALQERTDALVFALSLGRRGTVAGGVEAARTEAIEALCDLAATLRALDA